LIALPSLAITMDANKHTPPKSAKVTLSVRVDPETAAELTRRAGREDRSVSSLARRLILARLQEEAADGRA
jgi:hypothetical protein